jgi:membrane protein implicated in regulation of membrane protease activity
MPWLAWMILGAVLLATELAFIDAQFFLVFFGISALLVGAVGLVGINLPDWSQWLLFAVLSIVALLFFRRRIYGLLARQPGHMEKGPSGEEVTVPTDLPPGGNCRLEFRGSTWTAQNRSEHEISAGARARIVHVEGLTLHIRPSNH